MIMYVGAGCRVGNLPLVQWAAGRVEMGDKGCSYATTMSKSGEQGIYEGKANA